MNDDMETTTRPLFALYVVWHPSNANGGQVADLLRRRFGRDCHRNVAGDSGLSVLYRNQAPAGALAPLPIEWDEAETTTAVVLLDAALVDDRAWTDYVRELAQNTQTRDLTTRLIPVVMEPKGLDLRLEEQALRWDRWKGSHPEREQRLVSSLTYEFSRMLRHRLSLLRRPETAEAPLASYLEKIQVFISHSKHDNDGEAVARRIRNWLHKHSALASFFDVLDIPAGSPFQKVLLHEIETSIVMALHTDSYSCREWCRREVIEAKRRHVPMIVVDCLRDTDQRGIPYMGNVPIVRMNPDQQDRQGRIDAVIECLLAEVFRTYLWRCRVERFKDAYPQVLFTARPPELILLAALQELQGGRDSTIVYPEPLLGTDEARLFQEIAPNVRLRTLKKWLEEIQ